MVKIENIHPIKLSKRLLLTVMTMSLAVGNPRYYLKGGMSALQNASVKAGCGLQWSL